MEPVVAFSLDADLFAILERLDVDNVYIKWVKLLCRSCITTADRKAKFAPVSCIQELW